MRNRSWEAVGLLDLLVVALDVAPVEVHEREPVDAGEMPAPTLPVDSGSQMEPDANVVEPTLQHCVYTSPPDDPVPVLPDAGEVVHVSVRDNAFVGDYLVDALGKPLYIYTADLPGDCASPPQSTCIDNCVASWPVYDAAQRNLGEGLDQSSFGTIVRADGSKQSTYLGWPLYTFKSDNKPEVPDGFISGHGKRGLWMAARVSSYNIVVMVPESDSKRRYLASGSGRTLYSYSQDLVGSTEVAPSSLCVGQCRAEHPPVRLAQVSPGGLLPEDFSVFARSEGGGAQLAYKGKPLYWSAADSTRGEINGESEEWLTVEP